MNLPRFVVQLGLVLAVAAGVSVERPLLAQATTGTLVGQAQTSDGDSLPGATVTVKSPALQGERTVTTDGDGRYVIWGLPPGTYQVTLTSPSFQPAVSSNVMIWAGQDTRLDRSLSLATVPETILVTPEAPIVEIPGSTIAALPLRNRNPFALLAGLGTASVQSGRGPGQIGISGGLTYDNLFLLNGAPISNNLFGSADSPYAEDAVAEFQVLTNNFAAEFGRTTGGVVSAITRSGGNRFSGSARFYYSSDSLQSDVPGFTAPESDSQVYEITMGGSIVRDRLWFFGAGRRDQFNTTQTLFPVSPSIPGLSAPRESDDNRYEGKLTFTPYSGQRFFFDYNRVDRDEEGVPPVPTAATPNTLLSPTLKNDLFVGNYTGVLSDNFFVEAQYSERNFTLNRAGGTSLDVRDSPFFTFSGILVDGQARNGNVPIERNSNDISAAFSYFLSTGSFGSHELKGGYDTFEDIRREDNALGAGGAAFLTNYQTNAQGNFVFDGSGRVVPIWRPFDTTVLVFPFLEANTYKSRTNSFFINDKWRLNDFSFNVGARSEQRSADADGSQVVDTSDISPRLGLTWSPKGNGDWILNANYNQYVGSMNSRLFSDGIFGDQVVYGVYTGPSGTGFSFAPGYSPGNYIPFFLVDTAASTTTDPKTKPPTVREFSVGSSLYFPPVRISAFYTRRDLSNAVEDFKPVGAPTIPSISGVAGPAVDTVRFGNSETGTRDYDAVEIRLDRRSNKYFFNASYTFSRLFGNYAGVLSNGTPTTSANRDYPVIFPANRYYPEGPIDNEEQRHRLRAFFTVTQPVGAGTIDVGAVARIESGRTVLLQALSPLSTTQKTQAAGAGYLSIPGSQTLYFQDQTAKFDPIRSLDLSVTYTIGTSSGAGVFFKADVFNVFNSNKLEAFDTTIIPGGPNDAIGQPTTFTRGPNFGKARSYNDFQAPREFRFATGIRF